MNKLNATELYYLYCVDNRENLDTLHDAAMNKLERLGFIDPYDNITKKGKEYLAQHVGKIGDDD